MLHPVLSCLWGAGMTGTGGAARPWAFVWVLGAAQLLAWGSLYYAFAVVVVPMEAELGWSKTALNGALSLGLVFWGLAAPLVGGWIDRHGARMVMSVGAVCGGFLLVLWSQVTALWAFYAVWAALGVTMATLLYEPAFAVVTSLYGGQYRRAITVITLLGGFASTVLIPLTQGLTDLWGWRQALAVIGVAEALLCGAVHLAVLRPGDGRAPRAHDLKPLGGLRVLQDNLSNPVFCGLAVWFTAYGAIFTGLTFSLMPLMAAFDVSSAHGVLVMALIGPMQVTGRLILLAGGARVGARVTGAFVVLSMLLAVSLLLLAPHSLPVLIAFALLYGAGNGVMTIVRGTAVPDYLGDPRYATLNGALALPANLSKAAAPLVLAALWSATQSPHLVIAAILGLCVVALGGFTLAGLAARRSSEERGGR